MSDNKNDDLTSEGKQLAEAGLSSVLLNTYTSRMYAQTAAGEMDFTECFKVVVDKAKKITKNDTSELEVTLSAQVGSLDAIFASMARMAATSINDKNLHAVPDSKSGILFCCVSFNSEYPILTSLFGRIHGLVREPN